MSLLALWQFVVAWTSVRLGGRGKLTSTPTPTLLLRNGEPDLQALTRQRISGASLRQIVRSAGIGGLELVAAVVLELNGSISVIPAGQFGTGSAIADASK